MMKQTAGFALFASMFASILWMNAATAQNAATSQPPAEGALVVERQPGEVGAASAVVVRGAITAVDKEHREFTVRRPKGDEVVVTAGEEVRNFDQIKVGDQVVFRQTEAVVLELKKTEGKGGIRERSVREAADVAQPGDKPGIAAARRTRIVADVTAVDRKAGTVTLRGVHASRTLRARDPAVLKNVKKGDQVEATVLEGQALSIEAAGTR